MTRYLVLLSLACSPATQPPCLAEPVRIEPTIAITAGHCAPRAERRDDVADLAWLTVPSGPVASTRSPCLGERVTVRAPRGEWSTTVEAVSLLWGRARLSCGALAGDSGASVWGDDGALVCIVVARQTGSGRAECASPYYQETRP